MHFFNVLRILISTFFIITQILSLLSYTPLPFLCNVEFELADDAAAYFFL